MTRNKVAEAEAAWRAASPHQHGETLARFAQARDDHGRRAENMPTWIAEAMRADVVAMDAALALLRAAAEPEAKDEEPMHRVLCKHFAAARQPDAVEVAPRSWVCVRCAPTWPKDDMTAAERAGMARDAHGELKRPR